MHRHASQRHGGGAGGPGRDGAGARPRRDARDPDRRASTGCPATTPHVETVLAPGRADHRGGPAGHALRAQLALREGAGPRRRTRSRWCRWPPSWTWTTTASSATRGSPSAASPRSRGAAGGRGHDDRPAGGRQRLGRGGRGAAVLRRAAPRQRLQGRAGPPVCRARPRGGGGATMSPPRAPSVLGRPLNRVEGRLKVTGAARYAADHPVPGLVHAVLVTSTIAKGRIAAIDARGAEGAAGVLAVITHENADRAARAPARRAPDEDRALTLLQDAVVRYAGQPIAVVVAETFEQACHAAAPRARALPRRAPRRELGHRPARAAPGPGTRTSRTPRAVTWPARSGHPRCGSSASTARRSRPTTRWSRTRRSRSGRARGKLTLYDATPGRLRLSRAAWRGSSGFAPRRCGCSRPAWAAASAAKGPVWSHVVLAAMAARHVRPPVKLVLSREQMFGPVGWRPRTRADGGARRLADRRPRRRSATTRSARPPPFDEFVEPAAVCRPGCSTRARTIVTTHRLVRLDRRGTPSYMRAPGWAPRHLRARVRHGRAGRGASAWIRVALRLRNYAERDAHVNRPWSSKALRECYRSAPQRFGWAGARSPPGSMRDGETLRSAGAWRPPSIPRIASAASAVARFGSGGMVVVESGEPGPRHRHLHGDDADRGGRARDPAGAA